MQLGESGEDGFDILMDSFSGLIFFFGPKFVVTGLDVLTDHNKRHEKKLDDIGDENQENKREGIKGAVGYGLQEHPAKNEDHKKIDGVHGTDGTSDGDGDFVVKFEAAFVLEVNVNGNAAGFKITG